MDTLLDTIKQGVQLKHVNLNEGTSNKKKVLFLLDSIVKGREQSRNSILMPEIKGTANKHKKFLLDQGIVQGKQVLFISILLKSKFHKKDKDCWQEEFSKLLLYDNRMLLLLYRIVEFSEKETPFEVDETLVTHNICDT